MGAHQNPLPPHSLAGAAELRQSGESSAPSPQCGCLGNQTRGLGLRHLLSPARPTLFPQRHGHHQGEGGHLVMFFLEPGRITSIHPFFFQRVSINYLLCMEVSKF